MSKITTSMQKVAVDILQELEVYMMTEENVPQQIIDIYNKMYKKYELCDDPFTGMCCTDVDFFKSATEMEKQIMVQKYGHHDGIN